MMDSVSTSTPSDCAVRPEPAAAMLGALLTAVALWTSVFVLGLALAGTAQAQTSPSHSPSQAPSGDASADDRVIRVTDRPVPSRRTQSATRSGTSSASETVKAETIARALVRSSASDTSSADSTAAVRAGVDLRTLTLQDAVQVALQKNYNLRGAELDVTEARAQVREARGAVYPRVDISGSYTRNIVQANPFAGSDVSSFLGGGTQGDWVAFNERARTDDDPTTEPITFPEFQRRQQQAIQEAGISLGGGSNPFGVDNEFLGSVQMTQTLYDKSAFSALRGAQQFQDVSRRALDRQAQVVANDVYEAYYGALLAQQQVRVLEQRVDRTQKTLQEVRTQVRQGVAPKFQRLSAEVELSNLQTELLQAKNDAGSALDRLKVTLGLSVDTEVTLSGSLDTEPEDVFANVSATDAIARAVERRPDLRRAELAIDLREIEKETIEAQYYPRVEAVATFRYSGRVPDDREQILTDPNDPFFYATRERGFFSTDFWNPTLSAGLQMSWNIFNGFQTTARMEQQDVQISRAQLQYDQLRQSIELEVATALRSLETARRRILSQQQTVQNAETNYSFTEERVTEGVSSPLELREASDQLDRSRLNYLQAVYDYIVARSDLETALGVPLTPASKEYRMTKR